MKTTSQCVSVVQQVTVMEIFWGGIYNATPLGRNCFYDVTRPRQEDHGKLFCPGYLTLKKIILAVSHCKICSAPAVSHCVFCSIPTVRCHKLSPRIFPNTCVCNLIITYYLVLWELDTPQFQLVKVTASLSLVYLHLKLRKTIHYIISYSLKSTINVFLDSYNCLIITQYIYKRLLDIKNYL